MISVVTLLVPGLFMKKGLANTGWIGWLLLPPEHRKLYQRLPLLIRAVF
jgi:hypothetical protein